MNRRIVFSLLGAGALMLGAGAAVQIASASEPPELTAEYFEDAVWGGHMMGTFTVSNPSAETASDWRLSFRLPGEAKVVAAWNGTLSTSDGTVTIRPTVDTKTIHGHSSLTVGFTATTATAVAPLDCTLNGKPCKINARVPDVAADAAADVRADATSAADAAPAAGPDAPADAATEPAAGPAAAASGSGGTVLTTYIYPPAADRPPLKAIANGTGAKVLTLASAAPSVSGSCELKWGGTVDLEAFAGDIRQAVNAGVSPVVSIASTTGVDITQVCRTVPALKAQLARVVALGVRSLQLSIPAALLDDGALNLLRAQAIRDLKAQVPGLSVAYAVPAIAGVSLNSLTAPLAVARNAGAVIDRISILPVDLAAPTGLLSSLLGSLTLGGTTDSLLGTVTGVHERVMSILGLDAAAAWRVLAIVPALGRSDLDGAAGLAKTVRKVATFVRANGVGLLGFLPLNAGQCGGLVSLPILPCLNPANLADLFAVAGVFNRALALR